MLIRVYLFFHNTATTEFYTVCHTLSLHNALLISGLLSVPARNGWLTATNGYCDDSAVHTALLLPCRRAINSPSATVAANHRKGKQRHDPARYWQLRGQAQRLVACIGRRCGRHHARTHVDRQAVQRRIAWQQQGRDAHGDDRNTGIGRRSEEHTSELQSLMRISY